MAAATPVPGPAEPPRYTVAVRALCEWLLAQAADA
jgi:hypothetical protein